LFNYLIGVMGAPMTENSKIIIFKGREYIHGQMGENTLEIGKIIKWMDQESSLGQVTYSI